MASKDILQAHASLGSEPLKPPIVSLPNPYIAVHGYGAYPELLPIKKELRLLCD